MYTKVIAFLCCSSGIEGGDLDSVSYKVMNTVNSIEPTRG